MGEDHSYNMEERQNPQGMAMQDKSEEGDIGYCEVILKFLCVFLIAITFPISMWFCLKVK